MFLKVYIADITPLYDEKTYEYYYKKSIPWRQKKADGIKLQKPKCQSIGAGILLKKALEDVGVPKNLWSFTEAKFGKAMLTDARELMIDFSLSHSGDKVMCAISDCEVGCDVEMIKDNTKVANRFFTGHEAELARDNAEVFTRIWTLKESFIKATGEGLKRPLNSFEICFEGDYERTGILRVTGVKGDGIEPDTFSLYEWDCDAGYRYSVCVKATELTPEMELVKLINRQG
ncbi:MAG: 4'-phosphopantetheinyl transferase superfamily protein [Lachnospiraceae bacterium]|nr:4'-phosphopantetheinyl transferase superfamily protein [Lachnospiraceae bacterium]